MENTITIEEESKIWKVTGFPPLHLTSQFQQALRRLGAAISGNEDQPKEKTVSFKITGPIVHEAQILQLAHEQAAKEL